jgi:predicted metal-binding membrane protein
MPYRARLFSTASSPRPIAPGFAPLALGLAGLAWIILLGWHAGPYSRYLNHGDWSSLGLGSAICAAVPGGTWLIPFLIYCGGWVLMSAAMMLPTVVPLVRIFDRMISGRSDRATLHGLLITGYLIAWAGFGAMAYLLDWSLHSALDGRGWLAKRPWLPAVVVLAGTGAFQFSRLKYLCLEKCRAPLGFVTSHWHGPHPWREALALGLGHGVYCVGCCWALMLLMFLVGMGNTAWMLVLGLVMAVEKNHKWGRRLSAPLGITLAGVAMALLVQSVI